MRMPVTRGFEKRNEMQGRGIGFRVAMRPGKRRVLPDTPEGRLDDLVETAKAHIRAVPVQGVDIASGETEDTTRSVQAALAMVKFGLWQPSGGFLVEVKSQGNRSNPLHHNRSWLLFHPLNGYSAPRWSTHFG